MNTHHYIAIPIPSASAFGPSLGRPPTRWPTNDFFIHHLCSRTTLADTHVGLMLRVTWHDVSQVVPTPHSCCSRPYIYGITSFELSTWSPSNAPCRTISWVWLRLSRGYWSVGGRCPHILSPSLHATCLAAQSRGDDFIGHMVLIESTSGYFLIILLGLALRFAFMF